MLLEKCLSFMLVYWLPWSEWISTLFFGLLRHKAATTFSVK
jgi:hypothetical protein